MKVEWSQSAVAELESIHDHIARNSLAYADRMVDRLTRRAQQLTEFPHSGRAVPEFGIPLIREIVEGSYRLIYRIEGDRVQILAVVHGARTL